MFKIYLIFQLILFGFTLYLYWKLAEKKVGKLTRDKFEWCKGKKRFFIIAHVLIAIILTLPFMSSLRSTAWCAYKGHEHSVETRRDIFSGRCSFQGANGEWIPIERLIGTAEGTEKQEDKTQTDSSPPATTDTPTK